MEEDYPEAAVFLGKCALKICSKFTGEHLCGSLISENLYFGMGVLF